MRVFLKSDDKLFSYKRWYSTYGAVAKISYGLINSVSCEEVGRLNAKTVADFIRDTAVINVNKRSGGNRSDKYLKYNALVFESYVDKQIKALHPEIIIAGGTFDLLPQSIKENTMILKDDKFGATNISNDTWLVKCYHPAQTTINTMEYYDNINRSLEKAGWNHLR